MDLRNYQKKLNEIGEHVAEQYYPEANDADEGEYQLNSANRFLLKCSITQCIDDHFSMKQHFGEDTAELE